MLLKWLFTILAIIWLLQALKPLFGNAQRTTLHHKPPPPNGNRSSGDDDDDYIDYEEIKE